ncbi:MAG: TRAM domain-containing protein [Haloarculaceae archaeon]
MVNVPDDLRCLFSARVERQGDSYVVEIPRREVEQENVRTGEVYRVAALGPAPAADGAAPSGPTATESASAGDGHPEPPVEQGEVRTVTVETTGDQGDGIAKVERGYVVIVQDGEPGEEVTVEMTTVRENFAIAHIVEQ